jgi:predicted RNA binding protein YcfA (HicA-like mRNA interferase family)
MRKMATLSECSESKGQHRFGSGDRRVNRRRLLQRLSEGALRNVPFGDMMTLAEGFGFRLARVTGSHHILTHPGIAELINLQEVKGEAKPYQIRQLLRLIERYNLRVED